IAWILVPTFVVSLYISISRWNHRMTPPPSTPMSSANPPPPKPHSPQKGVLRDGFLVFNDNSKSSGKRMSLYSHSNRSTPHVRTFSCPNSFGNSTPNLLSDSSSTATQY
ncbi:15980_t:CDS:1, partial [Acaulospora colombiana]